MLLRFDPFRDLDRWFDVGLTGRRDWAFMPMDAYREGDHVTVRFDLPGVDRDSIDVTVEQHTLTVTASRSWEPGDGVTVLSRERPMGTVTRQLYLGEDLDLDNLTASYDDGVLTIVIPVTEEAKPRHIEIGRGQPALTA
ncbi:MAG: Hsp20/alpha crystallin family protein [Actinomyces sp.]|nr:MAG: Hsp20/alpha crystallin family protein [Actinomyces sp.]